MTVAFEEGVITRVERSAVIFDLDRHRIGRTLQTHLFAQNLP